MIRAGSHGQLLVDGSIVARCTDWQLSTERELTDRTPVYRWKQKSRPLRSTTRGAATIFYDPDEPTTATILGAVRDNEPAKLEMILYSDNRELSGYQFDAYISLLATAVAPQSATTARIDFQATGTVLSF